MNVLKFGGSSVGSVAPLQNVKNIVALHDEGVVVVVSALGGITDQLLEVSTMAERGDETFRTRLAAIKERHTEIMDACVPGDMALRAEIEKLLGSLGALCEGVFSLRVLPEKTAGEIVSFGERMSSLIIAAMLPGARRYDALNFIKTTRRSGKTVLDSELTERLVCETFKDFGAGRIAVVPGFISTDSRSGEITNLGRGGSDYTASIIAAALNADRLEIWTDVDGFMTADPRIISTSYVIDTLSYEEAMELCNFGAKVIYPPSLYPVCAKDIDILIKNTFHPEAKGTVISREHRGGEFPVTGISSIEDSCVMTVSAPSMAGIVGVNSRIFGTLADAGISVFLVSQSSSETGISIGISAGDAKKAVELLGAEFEHEIAEGSMAPVEYRDDVATVAIVGENMRQNSGVAGKLFTTLGRNGISIIALAQGTEERNISFVVEKQYLRKSLNIIHDSFFLSEYQELNLFICGTGTVGGQLIEQITAQRENLMKERNLKLNIVGIARSRKGIFDREGLDGAHYRELIEYEGIPLDTRKLRDEVIGMNIFNSVFVDCTASTEVASLYADFFNRGISVVAANKIAASSDYGNYRRLKETALKRNVKYLFEANVGAGLPIINTINDLVNSGDKIEKIEAVLSGTLNFIFNTLSADIPFSRTVRMAQEQGFSEPDPRIDLSGKDVIRKLVILAREAGYEVNQEDVEAHLFIPAEFFECSLEEFWAKLPSLDAEFESRRRELERRGERWRFVAKMENGKFSVSLQTVDSLHSFYVLDGSNNIVLLTTERYHEHPMLIQGYGAGAGVTAAGVFADIMSIANIH
ncbi:MAG: bifunctional aspartate kinase/homoserine dehydrogenase I [Bacteroidales bacterium]|nr:bifunctional aspartate kinase/homoserine dehydrogenase I [Bacteroidales bacterium]